MKNEDKLKVLLEAKERLEIELGSADLQILRCLDEVNNAINQIEREIYNTRRNSFIIEEEIPKYVLVNKVERDLYRDTPVRYLGNTCLT